MNNALHLDSLLISYRNEKFRKLEDWEILQRITTVKIAIFHRNRFERTEELRNAALARCCGWDVEV